MAVHGSLVRIALRSALSILAACSIKKDAILRVSGIEPGSPPYPTSTFSNSSRLRVDTILPFLILTRPYFDTQADLIDTQADWGLTSGIRAWIVLINFVRSGAYLILF